MGRRGQFSKEQPKVSVIKNWASHPQVVHDCLVRHEPEEQLGVCTCDLRDDQQRVLRAGSKLKGQLILVNTINDSFLVQSYHQLSCRLTGTNETDSLQYPPYVWSHTERLLANCKVKTEAIEHGWSFLPGWPKESGQNFGVQGSHVCG